MRSVIQLPFKLYALIILGVSCTVDASSISASYQQCVKNPETRAEYKLLEQINKTDCETAHVIDAIVSADVPATLDLMRDYHMEQYKEVGELFSLYHNLQEGITEKPTLLELLNEHDIAKQMKLLGFQPSVIRKRLKYLDPEFPNVKFVSKDGHKEVVYNKKTKKIVTGINGGTSNKATWGGASDHWWNGDIARFDRCGTPAEQQKILGEYLAKNPSALEWLAENPERIKSLLENIKLDISEARRQAKEFLLGDKSEVRSQFSNYETASDEEVRLDVPNGKQLQLDLHNLNLNDPNGDWCKCEKPGCSANMEASDKGYVIFGCTKCKKVNVKYAKMALALEQKMKDAGVKGMWHGPNAETNARRAASDSNK